MVVFFLTAMFGSIAKITSFFLSLSIIKEIHKNVLKNCCFIVTKETIHPPTKLHKKDKNYSLQNVKKKIV